MGGDVGPRITVPAALQALASNPSLKLLLVGQPDAIQPLLAQQSAELTRKGRSITGRLWTSSIWWIWWNRFAGIDRRWNNSFLTSCSGSWFWTLWSVRSGHGFWWATSWGSKTKSICRISQFKEKYLRSKVNGRTTE